MKSTRRNELETASMARTGGGLLGTMVLAAAVGLLSSGARPVPQDGGDGGQDVDGARAALEKWVEVRRIISDERREWKLGREMLIERSDLVRREIDSLKQKRQEAQDSISETDEELAELAEENDRMKEASTTLVETVVGLEVRTRTLLARLPEMLREQVKPLSQRIPEDAESTKLSLSERYMNVVGILDAVNEFNREITVASERHTLPDQTTAEVSVLYVGIGQGYYVTADGQSAGIGTAGPEGWTWRPADEAAPRVAEAIAIMKDEKVAAFVPLPVRVE